MVEVLASYKIAETFQGYRDIYNDDYDNLVLYSGGRETKNVAVDAERRSSAKKG
jgi:hypothetical protein